MVLCVIAAPPFTCEIIAADAKLMSNITKKESHLLNMIMGMVGWQYKLQYSWVVEGMQQFSIMDLHYCVDDYGVRGFKGYEVSSIGVTNFLESLHLVIS